MIVINKGEDLSKRVVTSLDAAPEELSAVLFLAIKEIIADLETRTIPPIPPEPEEIRRARDNQKRGKNSVN
jgi:hypothetical protein